MLTLILKENLTLNFNFSCHRGGTEDIIMD